ncbi:MAG: NADH-quinone oxidoreductase subunit M [Fimbriimonadaceae bacterium]|nr:NADH-quinone oxidoreductase subunit M [Fimbriimonadaceae bacterium]
MEPGGLGILTGLLALPLIGAALLALVPERFPQAVKGGAILVSAVAFLVSLAVFAQYQVGTYHMQMVEALPWIPQLGIQYKVGIDGISLWMIMLTTLLTLISCIFSIYIEKRVKAYFILVLLLETAMLGVFMALDLVLFYTFFEASLIPMALMIWIWGGANRNAAALKFFLYTFLASIFMLIGIVAMALLYRDQTGALSFDLVAMQAEVASGRFWIGDLARLQPLLFWSFALALMVKCPMFPFHTWLPDAHTEAPTAGSILLAGVLLKMGTYGFLRFCLPLFPDVARGDLPVLLGLNAPTVFSVLAVIGILYGAIVAAMQDDVKKLVAYSSVAHMGFVVLGIFSMSHTGMIGGAYQQLNHGISTGALFLLIGLLYERIHTRMFKDMGGLKAQMPIFAALFLIVMLSSVGLPGMNGFIGEFLALMGSFESAFSGEFGIPIWAPILAATGVIFAAVYLLWMFMKVFYGPLNPKLAGLKDLKPWEIGLAAVFVVFIFWGGLYPTSFTKPLEKAVEASRQMAVNPSGQRPTWDDLSMEIHDRGQLVRVQPRSVPGPIENRDVVAVIRDSSLNLDSPQAVALKKEHADGEEH